MSAIVKASGLVKPYWIHVGSGGLPIRDERDVVDFFFDRDELDLEQPVSKCGKGKGRCSKRDLELVAANKFGNSRCPPPYWTEAQLVAIERAGGLLLIPGDWPEPRAGKIWEHMVPFKPQITPCDAGEAAAKTSYVYVVQSGESPGDVAVRFGEPYEAWVKLRQANHDDPDGFSKPSSDAGACTFAKWHPGKRVKIPADWADPPKSDPVWKHVETHVLVSDPPSGVVAAPSEKDNSMHTRPYILQKGDTPGTLAGRHGVDKEQIFRANPQISVVKDTSGERNPHPPHWRAGQRINMPMTAAGVLGEAPSGQVGSCGACGSGGVGYYTQTPCMSCGSLSGECGCGGVVGAMPSVQRTRPAMQARPMVRTRPVIRSAAVQQPNPSWARKHPNWNGSYLAYWSMRVAAYVANTCGPVNYGSINAWLQSIPSPEAMVQQYGWVAQGSPAVYKPAGMWFAGPNDHIVAHRAAQAYCVSSQGNVHGPAGQVGCGKGSGGMGRGFGMDQFGGVAGFNKMVSRAVPQAQMQVKRVMPKIVAPWDQKHPNWNGSYLAYWSLRIEKIIEWNSFYLSTKELFYPCLYAIRYGNGRTQILNWLRSFSTPEAFANAMYAMYTASGPMITLAPPDLWFARPQDKDIAATAARRVLGICAGPTASTANLSGGVGAPRSGTVGASGDPCTPYGAAVTDVKPYYYIIQSDDIGYFWKIPGKFNMPTTKQFWQQMRNANLDWVGGFVDDGYGACQLGSLYPGAKLKVPGNWLEPKPGTKTEPIGGTTQTCGAGQIEMGGQCVDLPPGVSVPVGGACPTGTTNVGGLCIPNGGYTPPPGQGCLPGTKLNAATGVCEIPGGVGPTVIPGIPPVNGKCPTGMTKHSDGLCYAPGTAPPGITPVGLTTTTGSKADEGYPAWAWALLGLGAVAAVGGVAYYAKKKKDDQVEEEVEEEVVKT